MLRKILILLICLSSFPVYAEDIVFPVAPLSIVTQQGTLHFTVEIATTPQQEQQGLMYRKTLAPDHGMIFEFNPPQRMAMWMKNTYVPLDMVFVDENGIIQRIEKHATPQSTRIISSGVITKNVIELLAGVTDSKHIAVGDKIIFPDIP